MNVETPTIAGLQYDSPLEYAFVRWILLPSVNSEALRFVHPQAVVQIEGRTYRIDYRIRGQELLFAIELDGYAFHSDRDAFTHDRLRQNDLCTSGFKVLRFSYDSIRQQTARCVHQLQAAFRADPLLCKFLVKSPIIEVPDMDPEPMKGLRPRISATSATTYFDRIQGTLNERTLRQCQIEAFWALSSYFQHSGRKAACVMSVGAGKTTLGVVAALAFSKVRALILTPGVVIRGTFHKALDPSVLGNTLYGLPNGPLIPGGAPPRVKTLDRQDGSISDVRSEELLSAEIIISNFHSLGTGDSTGDLLAKLQPEDIDLIIVDEAHMAAADSYQRAFRHFSTAKVILMSACFQRLDNKPIEAEVVYQYRLIDSIADGNAKSLRVRRFIPREDTVYEIAWPNGHREEVIGKEALLDIIQDERKLSLITVKSDEPIRQVMRVVKEALDQQAKILYPVKPRVLFSALGERHAEQVSRIAREFGITCAHLHYSMSEGRIKSVRDRYERDSGELQGIVQLKMLGQGYDFPPITVVVPMRPYGSFSEFYQFIGRGIRVVRNANPSKAGVPNEQFLDIIYHADLGLDQHVETIYQENGMIPAGPVDDSFCTESVTGADNGTGMNEERTEKPETYVIFQAGSTSEQIIHDAERISKRKAERQREALALQYSRYAQQTRDPISFEQYEELVRSLHEL